MLSQCHSFIMPNYCSTIYNFHLNLYSTPFKRYQLAFERFSFQRQNISFQDMSFKRVLIVNILRHFLRMKFEIHLHISFFGMISFHLKQKYSNSFFFVVGQDWALILKLLEIEFFIWFKTIFWAKLGSNFDFDGVWISSSLESKF